MARPVDADSAETYESIVAAARTLLAEHGDVDSVSLRKVAAVASVSLGTIQYYFENKNALLEACLDGYYARLTALVGRLIPASTDPKRTGRPFIEYIARELFDFACQERALVKLRVSTNAKRGELHPKRQAEFMGGMIKAAAEGLEPHIELSGPAARLAIQSAASVMSRMAVLTESERKTLTDRTGPEAHRAIEEHVVEAVVALLRPKRAS